MAGPVYYYDPKNASAHRLPKEFDHTLFIYEWSRNWIIAVKLDENDNIAKTADGKWMMERFHACDNLQAAHGFGIGCRWLSLSHRVRQGLG